MHLLDARDRFIRETFHHLMEGALHCGFCRLEVIEGGAEAITESLAAQPAAKDSADAISGKIAAVICYVQSRSATVWALPGRRSLIHGRNSLPLTLQ